MSIFMMGTIPMSKQSAPISRRDPPADSSFERSKRHLTDRQSQVVELLEAGVSKESALRLSITEGTVKLHLHAIYQRLGISTRGKLIAFFFGRKPEEPHKN
jgi:two-component system nitrate/nitrite response regulator NarP